MCAMQNQDAISGKQKFMQLIEKKNGIWYNRYIGIDIPLQWKNYAEQERATYEK